MDSFNINWLEADTAIIDSLVASSTVPSNNASNDILQYLLQNDDNSTPNFVPNNNHIQQQPPPAQQAQPEQNQMTCSNNSSTAAAAAADTPSPPAAPSCVLTGEFRQTLSVVQSKDNFVTFMPVNSSAKKSSGPKKAKFKEPIFVTESPQNAYNKKKKKSNSNSNNGTNSSHSSGEENSDDDMLLDEELASSTSPSKLKQMTSKERRQLRNKISARNFRVRRKEYITQLEEKVEEHEKTIEELRQENAKLRKANEEIMKQLLNQPITPPSSGSSDEVFSNSSISGSEGHHSPEAPPVPNMFQFQLNDLYDFNLFEQQQQQQQQQQQPSLADVNNLFYLNHAVMPDWDIHQVLGEKGGAITREELQQQVSRDLLTDYPLLAPALMSIILRHTLSLEYVTSLAKEFAESIGADLSGTETPVEEDEGENPLKKTNEKTLKIEGSPEKAPKEEEDDELDTSKMSDAELSTLILNNYFTHYAIDRARGFTHEETIGRFRRCMEDKNSKCNRKRAKKAAQKKAKEENGGSSQDGKFKLMTLQAYCRVAGTLLRNPQRMTQVNKVLKEEIAFTHNKYTARVEKNYAQLINPLQKLRITGTSK